MKDKNKSKDEGLEDYKDLRKNITFIERECLKCREKYYLISAKREKCEKCGCYLD